MLPFVSTLFCWYPRALASVQVYTAGSPFTYAGRLLITPVQPFSFVSVTLIPLLRYTLMLLGRIFSWSFSHSFRTHTLTVSGVYRFVIVNPLISGIYHLTGSSDTE